MDAEKSAATRWIVGVARACSVVYLAAGIYALGMTATSQNGYAFREAASGFLLGVLLVFLSFTHSGQVFQFTVRRRLIAAILAVAWLALLLASDVIRQLHG